MKYLLITGVITILLVGCDNNKVTNEKKASDAPKTSTATAAPNTVTASAPTNK